MPRVPRIDYRGARHHVMNRGARRAPILGDDEARQLFLDVLAELPGRFAVRVNAYVLMPNHYHLLLTTPRANLSLAMRHLGAVFTQRLNATRGWDGPVFKGRFTNRIIGDVRYWMHLPAYLHLNPVPSLVGHPAAWRWSSHRAYAGLEPVPPWLTTADLIDVFGSPELLLEYIEEHRTGRGTLPDGWNPDHLWSPDLSAVAEYAWPGFDARPRVAAEALREVEQVTGVSQDDLCTSRMGRRDNRARWVAAWWLGRRAALTHREVARYMDCRAPSIANMLLRLRKAAEQDEELAGWIEALEATGRASS